MRAAAAQSESGWSRKVWRMPALYRLSAFARPGAGKAADQQQEPEQAGKDRQHADAAHHAGIAHFQSDPVVAAIGAAGPHRDDARHIDAVAVVASARGAARSVR